MAPLNILSVLPLCLLLLPTTTLALPHFRLHGSRETPFPTLALTSSAGVYPTGCGTGTGTGTGTAYYPTATASTNLKMKRHEPDHPFGFPPPYQPRPSLPGTASAPPILSSYMPTGTAPSASGTGLPYPSFPAAQQDVDAAQSAHRQHFEGPRKGALRPYYPYVPARGQEGGGGAGPSSATGPTGTGGSPWPMPTGTGTGVVPWPMPTGTEVAPWPVPTGASGMGASGDGYSV